MNVDFGSYLRAGPSHWSESLFFGFSLRLSADWPIFLVDNNQHA
jgi:hypothetical protein